MRPKEIICPQEGIDSKRKEIRGQKWKKTERKENNRANWNGDLHPESAEKSEQSLCEADR